jgi:ubiquinone/menaquinone biosynthesis C-methylase UbiE
LHILTSLLPPLPSDAVIHDNGCGTGAVTSAILAAHPSLTTHCTDANAYMIESIKWPNVKAEVMRAQELTFPDSFFAYSLTTFVAANLDDGPFAAGHLYRTLKPGGTAVVATWKSMPHDAPNC